MDEDNHLLPQYIEHRESSMEEDSAQELTPIIWSSPWDAQQPSVTDGAKSSSVVERPPKVRKQPIVQKSTTKKQSKTSEVKKTEAEKMVEKYIQQQKKLLVLMRGIPGSGKTFLAETLKHQGVILSSDDFFLTDDGEYVAEPRKRTASHRWNRRRAEETMATGVSPLIIDNCNIRQREMTGYIVFALKYDYEVEIVEPETRWRYNPDQCALKNLHGISKYTIDQRLDELFNRKVELTTMMEIARKKLEVNEKEEDDEDVDGD